MTIVNDSVQKSNCKACSYWFFFLSVSLSFSLLFCCFYFWVHRHHWCFFYSLSRATTATETTVIVFYERFELVCILIFIFSYHLPKRKKWPIDNWSLWDEQVAKYWLESKNDRQSVLNESLQWLTIN